MFTFLHMGETTSDFLVHKFDPEVVLLSGLPGLDDAQRRLRPGQPARERQRHGLVWHEVDGSPHVKCVPCF